MDATLSAPWPARKRKDNANMPALALIKALQARAKN
jgi:hypothetical protein